MNTNEAQSYWFVVREDQNNVVLSSNDFQTQGTEPRYIVQDSANMRQYVVPTEPYVDDEPQELEVTTVTTRGDPFWDKNKIRMFLNICSNKKYRNRDPKDKEMWKEIAPVIGTSPEKCCRKFSGLKSTFVRLYKKKLLGKPIKWVYFSLCEELFKENKYMYADLQETWDDDKIRTLLVMYMDLFNQFDGNVTQRKQLWKQIADTIGTTEFNCIRKFKDLRRSYCGIYKKMQKTGKQVKWPYLMYFQKICREGIRPKDKWNRHKVKELLIAFTERAHKFADSKYMKKDLWNEISGIVGFEGTECDKKFRNLKVTYMKLKEMENTGQFISKWRYYKYFEDINKISCDVSENDQFFTKKIRGDRKTIQLLEFYIENKDKFDNPLITNKSLWKIIAARLKLTSDECDKKFRNLKQSYIRIADQQSKSDKPSSWPYYSYFEKIYDKVSTSDGVPLRKPKIEQNADDMMVYQMMKLVDSAQDHKDSDRKFERLLKGVEESNNLQRERNKILWAMLERY